MKRVAIIGSGDLGRQIAYHIHSDTRDKVVGFFDEFKPIGTIVNKIPVIGGNSKIEFEYSNNSFDEVIIAVGYKHMEFRKNIYEKLKGKIPFYTFIHSTAYIDKSAQIGFGSIILPKCTIDQLVKIGENVLLNISCTIAHESEIENHSFISPSVAVAGFVKIGQESIIGINATIIDNITIPPKTQVGGGTVVIKNIEKSGLYVGNPAKFIR